VVLSLNLTLHFWGVFFLGYQKSTDSQQFLTWGSKKIWGRGVFSCGKPVDNPMSYWEARPYHPLAINKQGVLDRLTSKASMIMAVPEDR